jgi:Rrf2 family protein
MCIIDIHYTLNKGATVKFSGALEQACCIMAILAESKGQSITNEELNRKMCVSQTYLKKITRKLVTNDLIKSAYGVNGGYVLARPTRLITLNNVVEAIEGTESFFRPSGLIERVFVDHQTKAKLGVNLVVSSFEAAEKTWHDKLRCITLERIISDIKKGRI